VLFYTRDHLGSIRELTDGTQAIRGRYDYDPFGRMTKVQGDRDGAFGFTGDFWHAQSGLNLTLFRAYDPNLGRWVSRDPIGEMGGNNLYDYVLNSPTYFKDKYGLANEPPTNPNIPPPPGKPPVLPPDIVCEMCITSCRGTNVDPCGTLTCLEHCKWTACLHDADFGPAPGEKPPTWYAKAAQTAAPHAANWFETILQKMAPWMTF